MTRGLRAALAAAMCLSACSEAPEARDDDAIRIVRGSAPLPFAVRPAAAPAATTWRDPPYDPVADAAAEASQTAARRADPYRLAGAEVTDEAG